MENVQQFLTVNADKFPAEQVAAITEKLQTVDDAVVAAANLKSPTVALILALFLSGLGADRFYLGQTGLAIAKLVTCGGCGVWSIIDWFTAMKRAREYNANVINNL